MRSLHTDGMNPTIFGLILITALIAFWCGWLVLGRVSVYEISETARLESERVHPVDTPVGGRIVASRLSLARDVRSGDILLEIEAERESLGTVEERTRLATLDRQLATIDTEIGSEEGDIPLARLTADATRSQAEQTLIAAEAAARLADDQHRRFAQLSEQGLIAEADLVRSRAQAESRRAEVASARLNIERLKAEQLATEREHQGHQRALLQQRLVLEGQRAAASTAVMSRELDAEERRIRAPVDGRLGEIAPLQVGAIVRAGERVASIVRPGPIRMVAEFLPPALGRVRAGQPARLRLDGFPWTQYGHVPATVQSVATETRDGHVRVELAVHHPPASAIPLEHGLPGAVEVEVERLPPLALLMRTLGYALTQADARTEAPAHAGHHTP
jgi:membrane fusion protein (multidrug efflux system)